MSKTHAFALKDFDSERILSRKFFDSPLINGERMTDKTLSDVAALIKIPCDSISEREKRGSRLRIISGRLTEYQKKILVHMKKAENYSRQVTLELSKLNSEILAAGALDAELQARGERLSPKSDKLSLFYERYGEILKSIGKLQKFIFECIDANGEAMEIYYREKFAERLKQARKKASLSQQQLADVIGINRADLAMFESAKRTPSFHTLCKIVRCADFSADWLLKG